MNKTVIFFFLFLIFTSAMVAQNVTNVKSERYEDKIIITYDLKKLSNITVMVSKDGGRNYGYPLRYVSIDVGDSITPGNNKKIIWDVFAEVEELVGDDIRFKVQADPINNYLSEWGTGAGYSNVYDSGKKPKAELEAKSDDWKKSRVLFMPVASASNSDFDDLSYGAFLGWMKGFGAYAKFRSNFKFVKGGNTALVDPEVSARSVLCATGGMLFGIAKSVTIYAGAGYAYVKKYATNQNGTHIYIDDLSAKGVAADLGIMFSYSGFSVSIGANAIFGQKFMIAPELGVGILLGKRDLENN